MATSTTWRARAGRGLTVVGALAVAAVVISRALGVPSAHAVTALRTDAVIGTTDIGSSAFWAVRTDDGHTFSLEERVASGGGAHPTIVLLPGTNGWRDGYRRYAQSLTDAGFTTVTLCWFDDPRPGDNEIACPDAPAYRGVSASVVPDLRTVLRAVTHLPGVDGNRIGLWGLSRGGGEALLLASTGAKYPVAAISPLVNPRTKGALPTDTDVVARAHGITVPTLLVYGRDDPVVPYRTNALLMANAIRDAGIAPAPRVDGFDGSHDPSGAMQMSAPDASRVLADTVLFFHVTLGA